MNTEKTLVIVPTYNEAENIPALIERILAVLPDTHLLLVDDNSPDGTADLAERHFGEEPRFHLLRRTGRRGLGRSYQDGYRQSLAEGYHRVIQMDADFSHDPAYLPGLLQKAETADVVIGSRYCAEGGVRDWPLHRQWLSRFANRYVQAILGVTVRDATSGFRCYRNRALDLIPLDDILSDGYAFQVEMTYRARQAGLQIIETPIIFTERRHGKSKISRRVILEAILLPWRLRLFCHAGVKTQVATAKRA